MVTWGKGVGGRINWKSDTEIYTLVYIKGN